MIHTVRWPFAIAIAVIAIMGIGEPALDAALRKDPETTLPLIISARLPQGLVGFMLAALLIAVGLAIAYFGTSINTAFMWIFGTLAAGILPPNVLRWYWWRLNGWGYAAGVFGGMALSLGQVIGDQFIWHAATPLYVGFPVIALASTVITVAVALLTRPPEQSVLAKFYRTVQPAGAWRPVRQSILMANPTFQKTTTFAREGLNTALAVVAICSLYVGTLYLVTHRYTAMGVCFASSAALGGVLFFTWYKHLPPPSVRIEENEVEAASVQAEPSLHQIKPPHATVH